MTAPHGRKGFTLIEIISVLIILGILAAVAIPKYYDLQAQARIQASLTAVEEAQSRINLLFAQLLISGNMEDCKNFNVSTLNGSSNLGNNYTYSITDADDKNESGTIGTWRIYLETGFKGSKLRKDKVSLIVPPEGNWYVQNGADKNVSFTNGKTAYHVPENMRYLFSLSLPACE